MRAFALSLAVAAFVVAAEAQNADLEIVQLRPNLHMIAGAGGNIVVQTGEDGVFVAREVLAKHDENYMPPEASEAVKRATQTNGKIAGSVIGSDKK